MPVKPLPQVGGAEPPQDEVDDDSSTKSSDIPTVDNIPIAVAPPNDPTVDTLPMVIAPRLDMLPSEDINSTTNLVTVNYYCWCCTQIIFTGASKYRIFDGSTLHLLEIHN